jgi:hypothetical protein
MIFTTRNTKTAAPALDVRQAVVEKPLILQHGPPPRSGMLEPSPTRGEGNKKKARPPFDDLAHFLAASK